MDRYSSLINGEGKLSLAKWIWELTTKIMNGSSSIRENSTL